MKLTSITAKGIVTAATLALVGQSLIGCGPQNTDTLELSQQRVFKAPGSQKETGLVAEGVSQEQVAELVAQNPQLKFRILSKNHNIYEFFNIPQKELKDLIPEAQVSENLFFTITALQPQKFSAAEAVEAVDQPRAMATQQQKLNCKRHHQVPNPVIGLVYPKRSDVITFGENIKLSSAKSTPHSSHKSTLTKAWVINTPPGSKIGRHVVFGENLDYKPDTVGTHQIALVVQDKREVCNGSVFAVQVTDNRSFKLPAQSVAQMKAAIEKHQKTNNLNFFSHLKEINADKAATQQQGEGVVIAVIDSGVNYNHPFLAHNIELNEKEKNGRPNFDDDGNGIKDDVIGYDFHFDDAFPFDDNGHGSHVAGLAASPIFGVAKRARIIPIKALGHRGGDMASISAAILYATDRGADIINLSLGSYGGPAPIMARAIAYAQSKGVLITAGAGNGDPQTGIGVNADHRPFFPAALPHSNIISVAARGGDPSKKLASYSNFGSSVHIIAPGGGDGVLLNSAYMDNAKDILLIGMQGTSMATPVVSGVAALMKGQDMTLGPEKLKNLMMKAGTADPELKNLSSSGRYLDAKMAVDFVTNSISRP